MVSWSRAFTSVVIGFHVASPGGPGSALSDEKLAAGAKVAEQQSRGS
jgi:hypothetical protein